MTATTTTNVQAQLLALVDCVNEAELWSLTTSLPEGTALRLTGDRLNHTLWDVQSQERVYQERLGSMARYALEEASNVTNGRRPEPMWFAGAARDSQEAAAALQKASDLFVALASVFSALRAESLTTTQKGAS